MQQRIKEKKSIRDCIHWVEWEFTLYCSEVEEYNCKVVIIGPYKMHFNFFQIPFFSPKSCVFCLKFLWILRFMIEAHGIYHLTRYFTSPVTELAFFYLSFKWKGFYPEVDVLILALRLRQAACVIVVHTREARQIHPNKVLSV